MSEPARILQVMGRCKLVPEWVKPSDRQITDCYWLAYAGAAQNGPSSRSGDILRILEWVLFQRPDTHAVHEELKNPDSATVTDTLGWLLLYPDVPPIELPQRNLDGSLVTEDQFYAHFMAGKTGLPEQHQEARDRARKEAIKNEVLASWILA